MTVERDGLLATLCGYGTIACQTAGTARELVFREVPHPERLAAAIEHAISDTESAASLAGGGLR